MNPPLLSGETLQALGAGEQFIVDASNNIIGIVNRRANGRDLRMTRVITVDTDYIISANDDGAIINCTAELTIYTPNGLSPAPSFIPIPPPSGNLSLAWTGGATGNGAATTITRTRANNPAGLVVVPYVDVTDGYGVSGS